MEPLGMELIRLISSILLKLIMLAILTMCKLVKTSLVFWRSKTLTITKFLKLGFSKCNFWNIQSSQNGQCGLPQENCKTISKLKSTTPQNLRSMSTNFSIELTPFKTLKKGTKTKPPTNGPNENFSEKNQVNTFSKTKIRKRRR